MKILVIGGRGQGKSAFVKTCYRAEQIVDGENCSFEEAFSGDALDKLHLLVRRLMEAGRDPMDFFCTHLDQKSRWILICDEIGSGVVPLDKFERDWREQVGRLCCELARQAQIVERLCCGLPHRLKGQP